MHIRNDVFGDQCVVVDGGFSAHVDVASRIAYRQTVWRMLDC